MANHSDGTAIKEQYRIFTQNQFKLSYLINFLQQIAAAYAVDLLLLIVAPNTIPKIIAITIDIINPFLEKFI